MPQIDFEPLSEPTSKVDFEPLDQSTKASQIDFQPIEESKPPQSPTPASDKALSETSLFAGMAPVSRQQQIEGSTEPTGIQKRGTEEVQKVASAAEKFITEQIPRSPQAFMRASNIPTDWTSPVQLAEFAAPAIKPMVDLAQGAQARTSQIYEAWKNTPPGSQERYDALVGAGLDAAQIAAMLFTGGEASKLGRTEYAKPISETAPIHESLQYTGRPQEGAGQMPAPESGLGVQTRGQGQIVAEPPQETPQPIAAKPETPQPQGQPSRETGTDWVVDPRAEKVWDSMNPEERWNFLASEDPFAATLHRKQFIKTASMPWGEIQSPSKDILANRLLLSKGIQPIPSQKVSPVSKGGEGPPVARENQKPALPGLAVPAETTAPALTSPESADVGAVPVVADEPHVSAIANRFIKERADRGELGQITPGRGFSRDDLVFQGLKMPPEEINQHVSDLMQGTGDIVKQGQAVRVEEARLTQRSNKLSKIADADPKNFEARLAADNAFKDLEDFHNGPVAQLKQKWHATGLEMQGEIPVDLSTYNGLRQQWLRDVGEAPPAKVEPELRRTAQNVSKAIEEDNGARSKLSQAIDKESTRRKYPTADEVRNNIRERMGLEPCRT